MLHLLRWRVVASVALIVLCALAPSAHAQKTKAQLNTEINTLFPDNHTNAITPQILRSVTQDMVNSIMPTAPVVSGNFAAFNGTTGLLQDSGIASLQIRTVLVGNLTLWVRGDGNNTNCTGFTNAPYVSGSFPQACAKATWNAVYGTAASTLDFAGWTVTLKSGTTGTYTSGLFMSTAWLGGGSLVIDLAGSKIAETVTKGIINDVVQPGQIAIIDSVGTGNVSSAGFACIQNDAASAMNIGTAAGTFGITTGPCFDAHYEMIQDGNIYLRAAINIGCGGAGSCSGREMILVGTGSNFGRNGQVINILADQTYSSGTVVVFGSGYASVDGAAFNLGGHAIAGPRYSVTSNGSIFTSNAGINFIPGSTAGALVSDSGGCYDSTCYGSLADGTIMLGSLLATQIAAPGSPAAGKQSVWADSTAQTLQAKNPSGALSSMVYTQAAVNDQYVTGFGALGNLITAKPLSCPVGCVFQSNGTTTAGVVTTGQKWGFGSAVGAQTPTNTIVAISNNVTVVDAATPGLSPMLHLVAADSALTAIILDGFGQNGGFGFRRANGTAASPTVVVNTNVLGSFFGLGYDASGSKYGYSGEIDFTATETWSNTAHGGGIKFWNVVNGTTTQVNSMTLNQSGSLSVGTTTDIGSAGAVLAGKSIGSAVLTVATLPTCNAGYEGQRAYVTDQNTAISYRGAVTGGGATRQAVLCSNSAWIQS